MNRLAAIVFLAFTLGLFSHADQDIVLDPTGDVGGNRLAPLDEDDVAGNGNTLVEPSGDVGGNALDIAQAAWRLGPEPHQIPDFEVLNTPD